GGAEDEQDLVLEIGEHAPEAESGEAQRPAQHDDDEEDADDVDAGDELAQLQQRVQAILADGERDGAKRGERREIHDDAHHAEEPVHGNVEQVDQRLGALSELAQREPEQHGEEQHRQDVAAGEGADEAVGHDAEQEIDDRQRLGVLDIAGDQLGVEAGGIGIDAGAEMVEVADSDADEQRQRRHRLEIDQRLGADPGDLAQIAQRGDADHDGQEDDRLDDGADRLDEAVAQRLQRRGKIGIEPAQ